VAHGLGRASRRSLPRSRVTAPAWQYADWPTIDPVRNLIAFWAVDGSEPDGSSATVVVRKGATLEQVACVAAGNTKHWPTFAADGRLVVRVLVDTARGRERIVVAGTESRDYERVGTPRCSPGGSHIAAAMRRDGKGFLWIDGHEVGPFDAVGNPRFVVEDLIGLVVRNGPDAAWHAVRARVGRS